MTESSSQYSRDAAVAAIRSYYVFLTSQLPRLDRDDPPIICDPPPTGWPDLDATTLAPLGKTTTVTDLLRHLPYLGEDDEGSAFVAPYTRAIHYSGLDKRWRVDWHIAAKNLEPAGAGEVPAHVAVLTQGGRDASWVLLDTEKGEYLWPSLFFSLSFLYSSFLSLSEKGRRIQDDGRNRKKREEIKPGAQEEMWDWLKLGETLKEAQGHQLHVQLTQFAFGAGTVTDFLQQELPERRDVDPDSPDYWRAYRTLPIAAFFEEWKDNFRRLEWVAMPNDDNVGVIYRYDRETDVSFFLFFYISFFSPSNLIPSRLIHILQREFYHGMKDLFQYCDYTISISSSKHPSFFLSIIFPSLSSHSWIWSQIKEPDILAGWALHNRSSECLCFVSEHLRFPKGGSKHLSRSRLAIGSLSPRRVSRGIVEVAGGRTIEVIGESGRGRGRGQRPNERMNGFVVGRVFFFLPNETSQVLWDSCCGFLGLISKTTIRKRNDKRKHEIPFPF